MSHRDMAWDLFRPDTPQYQFIDKKVRQALVELKRELGVDPIDPKVNVYDWDIANTLFGLYASALVNTISVGYLDI